MKRISMTLGLALCMGLTNVGVLAQEPAAVPILKPINNEELVSIHQINMNVPITRAEFIMAIVNTTGEQLPPVMDTHYAMSAMKKAEEMGLIDLAAYPMESWSEIMPNEEKVEVLSKAMNNEQIDMGKVYTALSQLLVEKVEVDGMSVDLKGIPVSHYNGKLMLPLRSIAEAMGFKVTWNKDTYSATLNNGQIQSTVEVGFDSYYYSSMNAIGMSAPFSAGVAPRFIDGMIYVPVDYFSLFTDVELSNGIVHFTMK